MNKSILAIMVTGIWITFSEFLRNELLFANYWHSHYRALGLQFETTAVNGMLWTLWSFVFAYVIFELMKKFTFLKALYLSWLAGFVMMWICTYNLQVLPLQLLFYAVPLSLLEIAVAGILIKKIAC